MNIQEYISSGIVESYVLGLASDEERKEFEKICTQYPEALAARTAFELALEKQALENAIAPPADLKIKIFDKIGTAGKVVPMQSVPAGKTSWLKYAVAASVILLAMFINHLYALTNETNLTSPIDCHFLIGCIGSK